jgi:N-acetyl sugar amidotransferase
MEDKKYQVCIRCVMDTTDLEIVFDKRGVCNHCYKFDDLTTKRWFPNEEGKKKLETIFNKIKQTSKKQEYDCIIGLSGGVDSSYLAVVMKDYGLRPLIVHVDAGWNSEFAMHNIERIVKYCGYDLHTHVMDWQEIKDLQLAYLKSGIANQDVVQDHAIFASIYHFAVKNNIKYVINGGNIATESVFPKSWHHDAMDAINLKAIHQRYGKLKLRQYRTINFMEYFFYYPFIKGMTTIRPLNFVSFHKSEALEYLKKKVDFKEYGRKHGESRFTKFFQNYYLPSKFNIDKRRAHLSSQILSGDLTRDQALQELLVPLYEEIELQEDKSYIAKKLCISVEELEQFIYKKGHYYYEYPNWDLKYKFMINVKKLVQKIIGRNVRSYS